MELYRPRYKKELEALAAAQLMPYACAAPAPDSRQYPEQEALEDNRGSFQRDRDRIIHCQAFRRLMYKTQVFVNQEGDSFRTRLTHSLEVSQIARGISKSLGLNEDLTEAISLGHDLGHTPFGHAAEECLDARLQKLGQGRYLHNEQSVRLVSLLETRSHNYPGLNLTREVREGILKHNRDRSGVYQSLYPQQPCSTLEGQVVSLADTVAYLCHDLQDAVQSGQLWQAVSRSPEFAQGMRELEQLLAEGSQGEIRFHLSPYQDTFFINVLIHKLVLGLIQGTLHRLEQHRVESLTRVQQLAGQGVALAGFDPADQRFFAALRRLVYRYVYGIHTIAIMDDKAELVVGRLFDRFCARPQLLPEDWKYRCQHLTYPAGYDGQAPSQERVICDYIGSMTDRFALEEYDRLFDPRSKI